MSDKIQRLEVARRKVDELTRRKERINGALDEKRRVVADLEDKAQKEFGCDVSEIPDLVEQLDTEAEEAIRKAERLLGIERKEEPEDEDAIV